MSLHTRDRRIEVIVNWRAMAAAALLVCLAAAPAVARCPGDCDGSGSVAINELIAGVAIALGSASVETCAAMDDNGNGVVAINELVAAVAAALGACPSGLFITDFVQTMVVIDLGAAGVPHSGAPPAPSGGPRASAPQGARVINGGTTQVQLSADAPFSSVLLAVEPGGGPGSTSGSAPAGVDGFFELALPQAVDQIVLQLTLAPDVPPSFRWLFQVADASGAVGDVVGTDVEVTEVGIGDLQISVSWDSVADVDLHVIEPSGEEVYFANTPSMSGGRLDLDARCFSDIGNENISWPVDQAPSGHYVVRAAYFKSCEAAETNYVVTVRRRNQPAETFRGTFTGPGDREGPGAGETVTEFDR
ncbi:MAG: YfaP family protein [Candidatus Binatia bacterium]